MSRAILILLTLFLVGYLVFGKEAAGTYGSITGRVESPAGRPYIGAVIKVLGTRKGGLSKAPDGRFAVSDIKPGEYTISVAVLGGEKIERTVLVKKGQATDVGVIRLHIAGIAQEVEVTARRVEVKRERVGAARHVTEDEGNVSVRSDRSRTRTGPQSKAGSASSVSVRGGRSPESRVIIADSGIEHAGAPSTRIGDSGVVDRSGERYETIYENPFVSPLAQRFSTFSIDVDAASYSIVRSFLNAGTRPPADAVRIEELINYFDFDYPDPVGDQPFSLITEISDCPWNREHRLVQVAIQGRRLDVAQLPPANLVFLLDVSGSMQSPEKLPLVKEAFRLLVDQLRPQDQISIVVYAGAAGLVLPPTSGSNRSAILAAIDGLEAGGSTAGGAGIVLAYETAKKALIRNGNNRVIIATDGDFNVGVASDDDLVRLIEQKRDEGVFLTVLGFGTGNYQDAKMEKLADKGNGNYSYIDNMAEAKKVFVNEMGATLLTIASDVKIQLELDPARVREYRLIGYENRLLAREDFDDDRKDAGELGAGHAVTALYELVPTVNASTSEWHGKPDTLDIPDGLSDGGLIQVRLRYKLPGDSTSRLIEQAVIDRSIRFSQTSESFRFSASVAEFGMLLRDSRYKSNASFDEVLRLSEGARSNDRFGYKAEFIGMVKQASSLVSATP